MNVIQYNHDKAIMLLGSIALLMLASSCARFDSMDSDGDGVADYYDEFEGSDDGAYHIHNDDGTTWVANGDGTYALHDENGRKFASSFELVSISGTSHKFIPVEQKSKDE